MKTSKHSVKLIHVEVHSHSRIQITCTDTWKHDTSMETLKIRQCCYKTCTINLYHTTCALVIYMI